jgi:PPOX class probable F420-dependent enzyme
MSMLRRGLAATDSPRSGGDDAAMNAELAPAARIDRMLRTEPVLWLSTVRPDGGPHLIPIWFSWDGREILIASKPGAQKVRNLRANPVAMLALGEAEDDFDVGLLEGRAELLDEPAAASLPAAHLAKYRAEMARLGLEADEFLATYSQVIRIRPTRFLPWHGRTISVIAAADAVLPPGGSFIRRVVERLAGPFRTRPPYPVPAATA